MNFTNLLRSAAIAAVATIVSGQAPAEAAVILSFSGVCTAGCAGTATGTLSMADGYVSGTAVTLANINSFSYTSNTRSQTIVPTFVGGGSVVPGSTYFDAADGVAEFRNINGVWDLSLFSGGAYIFNQGGTGGLFTLGGTPGPVPEPSSLLLITGGLVGVGLARRFKG